jgi:signal transduction histidine kinase
MKLNHIAWLIAASALGMLALIWFQVRWMKYSRELLEEQFNNRVNMALCSTVEKLAADQASTEEVRACCAVADQEACRQTLTDLQQRPEMRAALADALQFYQIDLPFEVSIAPRDSAAAAAAAPFSCSLGPILEDDTHLLQLEFQGKSGYFLQRLGLMITSSIAILGFVCLVFGLATYYLLRQKRMSDRNRDFFNQMTHEFRTPLTNIQLAGNMLARRQPGLAASPYLGIIRRECAQLTHQVENVLYLAGLEKGDYRLRKEPIDLRDLAGEVVAGMDLQIRERAAEVRLDAAAPPCPVRGDAFHLANAFRNLLDNALKYGGAEPRVEVAFQAEPAGCRVRFSDNGAGLSARDRRKIFQKFYRCDPAAGSGEKGFGLGLAYVKKIVEMHHGQVTVGSGPGHGAQFDVYLPS